MCASKQALLFPAVIKIKVGCKSKTTDIPILGSAVVHSKYAPSGGGVPVLARFRGCSLLFLFFFVWFVSTAVCVTPAFCARRNCIVLSRTARTSRGNSCVVFSEGGEGRGGV